MAGYTFLQLVNQVLPEIDEETVATLENPTSEVRRVMNYINTGYELVWTEKPDWSWTRKTASFSTVPQQGGYTVGTDLDSDTNLRQVHQVQMANYPPIRLVAYQEFARTYYEGQSGVPFIGYVQGPTLLLYPTPDQAYSITLTTGREFTPLSADNDVPLIPQTHRSMLYQFAIAMAKAHDKEGPESQTYMTLFQRKLETLRGQDDQNHGGYYIQSEDEQYLAEDQHNILYW